MKSFLALGIVLVVALLIFIYLQYSKYLQRRKDKLNLSVIKLQQLKEGLEELYLEQPSPSEVGIPMVYINLDRSKNRRSFMEEEARRYNLSMERVPAIDSEKIVRPPGTVKFLDTKVKYIYSGSDSQKELACTLSHIKAILTLEAKGIDIGIVLEDDVCFATLPHSEKSISQIVEEAPEDWEILKLYNYKSTSNRPYHDESERHLYSAAAYVINRRGMKKIAQQIKSNTIDFGSGKLIADEYLFKCCRSYAYTGPAMVFPYNVSLGTTIQKDSEIKEHCYTAYKNIKSYSRLLPKSNTSFSSVKDI